MVFLRPSTDDRTSLTSQSKRRIFLRDLFWLMLVVAAGFGAYRWGFQARREYIDPLGVTTIAHRLPFALDSQGGDNLCQLITTTIQPDTWSEVNGAGKLAYLPTTNTLVVTNRRTVQGDIADLIGQLQRMEHPKSKGQPGAPQSVQEFLEQRK